MPISLWQHLAWAQYIADKVDRFEDGSSFDNKTVDAIYENLADRGFLPLDVPEEDVKTAINTLKELPGQLILSSDEEFRAWTVLRDYSGSDSTSLGGSFRAALYSGEEAKVGAVSATLRQLVALLQSSQQQSELLCKIASGSGEEPSQEDLTGIVDSFLRCTQLQRTALESLVGPTAESTRSLGSAGSAWLQPPLRGKYPDEFLLAASFLLPLVAGDPVSDVYQHLRLQFTEATAFRFIRRALLGRRDPKSTTDVPNPEGLVNTFRLAADKRDVLLLRFLSVAFPDIVVVAPNLQAEDVQRLVRVFSSIDPNVDPAAPTPTLPASSSLQEAAAPHVGDAQHFKQLLAEAEAKVQVKNAGKFDSEHFLDFVSSTMQASKHTISTLAWLMCQGAEFPEGLPLVDASNVFLSLDLDNEEAVAYLMALYNNTNWINLYAEKVGSCAGLVKKMRVYIKAIRKSKREEVALRRLAVFMSALLLELISVGLSEYVEDLHFTASSRGDPELEEIVKMSGTFLRLIQESRGVAPPTPPSWSWKDAVVPLVVPAAVGVAAAPFGLLGLAASAITTVAATTLGKSSVVRKATASYQVYSAQKGHFRATKAQILQVIDPMLRKASADGQDEHMFRELQVRSAGVAPMQFVAEPEVASSTDVAADGARLISRTPGTVVFFVTCVMVTQSADGRLTSYTQQPSTRTGELQLTYGQASLNSAGDTDTLIAELEKWRGLKSGRVPDADKLDLLSLSREEFFAQVKEMEVLATQQVNELTSSDGTTKPGTGTLLLSHGYNVSFPDGVTAAAILRKRMKHAGPIVLFNWPSRAQTLGYWDDLDQIERAVVPLVNVVNTLKQQSDRILVVGHSMGCELSTRALSHTDLQVKPTSPEIEKQLQLRVKERPWGMSDSAWQNVVAQGTIKLTNPVRQQCHQFAFAAADVDINDFITRAKVMATRGVVTLYCSEDRALLASRTMRLFSGFRMRAGDVGTVRETKYMKNYHIYDTVDTDHEGVDPGIQHSWVFRSDLCPTDIAQTFAGAVPPRPVLEEELKKMLAFVRRLIQKPGKIQGGVNETEFFQLRPAK